MTRLINDAQRFATESLNGFAAAHASVRLVHDAGVTRSAHAGSAQVSVIMGGGAGHYPAFLGWVGTGLADGAVSGNIFSSPSAAQVVRVAKAALGDRSSILLLPINYAGDILHFSEARERLIEEGHDVRLVAVTDDIASASSETADQRRGIAGSFIVAKIVGAAAEAGADIGTVERIAHAANGATRSLGLAFSGCTLPGSSEANFDVPDGQMALGLGIHGEPGLRMLPLESADHAADILVDGLFAERAPRSGARVAVLINGLGSTKYDELNVVFGRVAERISNAGMTLVAPVVGELVTSLDMAGVSLSITYLDDELEELWIAPAQSVAFTRVPSDATTPAEPVDEESQPEPQLPPATSASVSLAAQIVDALEIVAREMSSRSDQLAQLDAVAGDGDHGACMQRGSAAAHAGAVDALRRGSGAGSALIAAGEKWSDVGGGTSGALWGAGLRAAGAALGDSSGGGPEALRETVEAFARTVVDRGGASVGDKTMLDAIIPFTRVLTSGLDDVNPANAWRTAVVAAGNASDATAEFVARRGRSRTHGDASLGTPDPGAISFALIVRALDRAYTGQPESDRTP